MRNADGDLIGSFDFRKAPLGAGGFVTGLDISADGTRMVHWTDVCNGYIRNAGDTQWAEMLRLDTLQQAEYDPFPYNVTETLGGRKAMYSARIAPSDKDRIYCVFNAYVFKSTDGGASYIRTALAKKKSYPGSGASRRFNLTLDVHPTDPDIVIFGTSNDGVHYSTDGGTTWGSVAGLPATINDNEGVAGKYLVGFDPGQPATVYIFAFGTGLYRSTTGVSGTFTAVDGAPTRASNMIITPAGVVYLCEYRTGPTIIDALKKMTRAGTWSTIAGSDGADQVAVNPNDANHIVWMNENGGFFQTRDGGATRTSHAIYRADGETKWFSNRTKPMYPAQLMFDPVVADKLWVAEGIGVSFCTPPTGTDTVQWHDFSNGNEELVPMFSMTRPGQSVPILTCWDKPIWRLEDTRKWTNSWSYPVPAGETFAQGTVTIGHVVDWAIDDPEFLAAVVGQGGRYNGFSNDFGRTWTKFATDPGFTPGGCLAVSTRDNIVVCPSNNGGAYYTKDGGVTWDPVSIMGHAPVTHWASAYYVGRVNITADKERPGVFACFINNIVPDSIPNVTGRDNCGVWRSTDGGETWTARKTGVIHGSGGGKGQLQFWQAKLLYIPGYSGELLYADGIDAGNPLVWSQDDGLTWTDVRSTVRKVRSFGFGKPAPGQSRPTVFLNCLVNGVQGIYMSTDWFATDPQLLTRFPDDSIADPVDVNGDLNVFGRCFVGLGGRGFAMCEYGKRFTLT
jgi:hypothetical protein